MFDERTLIAIDEHAPDEREAERVIVAAENVAYWDSRIRAGWMPLPNGRQRRILTPYEVIDF